MRSELYIKITDFPPFEKNISLSFTYIINSFLNKQERSLHFFQLKERQNIDRKIKILLNKQKKDIYKNIKRIECFCNVPINTPLPLMNEQQKTQYSFSRPLTSQNINMGR